MRCKRSARIKAVEFADLDGAGHVGNRLETSVSGSTADIIRVVGGGVLIVFIISDVNLVEDDA